MAKGKSNTALSSSARTTHTCQFDTTVLSYFHAYMNFTRYIFFCQSNVFSACIRFLNYKYYPHVPSVAVVLVWNCCLGK